MENTQGNLFEQPDEDEPKQARPADAARLQLTPEASARRARKKEEHTRRAEEEAKKHQERVERAAEQGIDLRTHTEIRRESAKRGIAKAREELSKTTPQPDVNI